MQKHIGRLQFITLQNANTPIEQQVMQFCAGGGNWVQLRLKNMSKEEMLPIAQKCMMICLEHNATFIVNDHVDIALAVDADGVHLGKGDSSVQEARELLGPTKIIGGTANTFEDIKKLSQDGADYIGLGPFRFTSTKEKLSPVIGLDGYQQIFAQCKDQGISTPIVTIGGILPEDIHDLFDTGAYGIALSSHIANSSNIGLETINLLTEIGIAQSNNFLKK